MALDFAAGCLGGKKNMFTSIIENAKLSDHKFYYGSQLDNIKNHSLITK